MGTLIRTMGVFCTHCPIMNKADRFVFQQTNQPYHIFLNNKIITDTVHKTKKMCARKRNKTYVRLKQIHCSLWFFL